MVGPALAHLLERDRAELLGGGGGLRARRIHHDHRAQVRHLLADLGDLRELLVVLAHDRARVGVGDHPQALLRRVRLVDRHDDRAGGGRGHVDVRPLRARVREDAQPLAGLDAEVDQPEADLLDDVGELRVGDVVPGAIALVAHRDMLGMLGGRLRDQVCDRARPGGRRGGGRGLHQDSFLNNCGEWGFDVRRWRTVWIGKPAAWPSGAGSRARRVAEPALGHACRSATSCPEARRGWARRGRRGAGRSARPGARRGA